MPTETEFDYSKTLNLPTPDVKNPDGLDTNAHGIPQRANLPRREQGILDFWKTTNVYQQSLRAITAQGTFILHDGPPYSNGNIHAGHALNKILKDIIVKYKTMQGYQSSYVPGWDNHGLPIEMEVRKEFLAKKETPSVLDLRRRCREYAREWVEVQKEQFKRLGVRGDWDHPYLTMANGFEASILDVFRDLVAKGFVYRGVKPVYWCIVDQTALADHEIEYADRTDPSIYVRFGLRGGPSGVLDEFPIDKTFAVIWTTTPWTIPANLAVAVNPALEYVVVRAGDDYYVMAGERVEAVAHAAHWRDYTVVKTFPGLALQDVVFEHPLIDRSSPVVFADYVTIDDGSGIVHTAPGHGREDFLTGQKYGLPTLSPVDNAGRFTIEAGDAFVGQRVLSLKDNTTSDGNTSIVNALRDVGALLAHVPYPHSYPHCWRCHNPVIFRATPQWFMSIDHANHREKCLEEIQSIAWFPSESINRITSMVSGRPDWCLSRQRAWGVGIPVFYCTSCDTEILDAGVITHVRDLVAEHSSDVWFERDAADLLPSGFRCPKCQGGDFEKESDIFDVWFDSGSTNRAVLDSGEWPTLSWPADVYLEGGDQHRGWFNSSLMLGVATKGHAPFHQVITNGWTLDEVGKQMHKSVGNVVAPSKVIEKYGADVLRFWVGSADYFQDLRVGDNILEQVAGAYRQVRNTLRFCLVNLYDFDVETQAVPWQMMPEIDRHALMRLTQLIAEAQRGYDGYEFHRVTQAVKQFCTVDLSAFYLDVLKDRLYADGAHSHSRRAAQTVLFEITSCLSRMLSPILSFTSEEVWQKLQMPEKPMSVELAAFPAAQPKYLNEELAARWTRILSVRDEVNKALEAARQAKQIGKALEAKVIVTTDAETFALLAPSAADLASYFVVSHAELRGKGIGVSVEVLPADGVKCARCWLLKTDVDAQTRLCGRCRSVLYPV